MNILKICPNCHASNEQSNHFCTNCGSVLETMITCPFCEAPMPIHCKECPSCHTTFGISKTIPSDIINGRTFSFSCGYLILYGDASNKKGTLTISPDRLFFHSGWSILGPGIDLGIAIADVKSVFLVQERYGLAKWAILGIDTFDGRTVRFCGPNTFDKTSNIDTLKQIAYIIELYRRVYQTVIHVPMLAQVTKKMRGQILDFGNISDEELFEKYHSI